MVVPPTIWKMMSTVDVYKRQDGEPAAVAADVGEDLRRGFGVDLADEVLVDVILFLETEVFHCLCIVALDLFLRVAEVSPQDVYKRQL